MLLFVADAFIVFSVVFGSCLSDVTFLRQDCSLYVYSAWIVSSAVMEVWVLLCGLQHQLIGHLFLRGVVGGPGAIFLPLQRYFLLLLGFRPIFSVDG
jgi:hypothetical protein